MCQFLSALDYPPPKTGCMIILIAHILDEDQWFPTENNVFFRTMGYNSLGTTGEDIWHITGWNWECEEFQHFTDEEGGFEIIGWQNMYAMPPELANEDTE